MIHTIYIGQNRYRLDASAVVGQGGEAIVYRLDPRRVAKVYMLPTDPVYAKDPTAQEGARRRLAEHQRKLPAFPGGLPSRVVAPAELAYRDAMGGHVAGYTMPYLDGMEVLLSYGDSDFRRQHPAIDGNQVVAVFRDLHDLVKAVHAAGVVIGDFNDLNVLVSPDNHAHIVDADSMQFGTFMCRTFTGRFVDPLHVAANPDPGADNKLQLVLPHSVHTDWYAFATMLFQSLVFVHPFYGGVHKPKGGKQYRLDSRILRRISVFSPDVRLPKAAIPLSSLPDELLEFFQRTFEADERGAFPIDLLHDLRWAACIHCGLLHARRTCPACAAPGAPTQKIAVRGNVTATRLFTTTGQILFAAVSGGRLRYVYHESGAYWREERTRLLPGQLDGNLHVRTWGDKTVLAKGMSLVALGTDGSKHTEVTGAVNRLPMFAANYRHLYWLNGDHLVRDGTYRPEIIGTILPNRTRFWVGDTFGFGFYRAGALTRGFVFDADRLGLNDTVPLPPMLGNLIDATCTFARNLAWFMVTIEEGGVLKHRCYVINDRGALLATGEATDGDGTWLGTGIRGHLATGEQLFVATDAGLVRVGLSGQSLQVTREYPDTEPFLSTATQLVLTRDGIVAVSHRDITLLQIR